MADAHECIARDYIDARFDNVEKSICYESEKARTAIDGTNKEIERVLEETQRQFEGTEKEIQEVKKTALDAGGLIRDHIAAEAKSNSELVVSVKKKVTLAVVLASAAFILLNLPEFITFLAGKI